jgi:DNA excision repair protein ERCC-2
VHLEDIFPYEKFRKGQQELALSVYNACKKGDRLVVEAMSGFGKTSPVLAGSVLAAHETGRHIVYACRTKRQVFRVIEEIRQIQKKIPLSAVPLFAKIDYCLLKETSPFRIDHESFKWYCSFNTTNNLCSYFLNMTLLENEIVDLVQRQNTSAFSHSEWLDNCRALHVCPYEAARLSLPKSVVVITTYHYLLNEDARGLLMAVTGWHSDETIAVIDEAHNLRDFLSDGSRSTLTLTDLEKALHDAIDLHFDSAQAFLHEFIKTMKELCSQGDSWRLDSQSLLRRLKGPHDDVWIHNLSIELSTCAGIGWQSISTGRSLPSSIMKVGAFLVLLLSSADNGATIAKSEHEIHIVNVRSERNFAKIADKFHALVLLSATINPSKLFLNSIGLQEETAIHQVNPDEVFNVKTIIDTGVTTRFSLRSPETYSKIAGKIAAISRSTKGNIGVFLPSYNVLETMDPLLTQLLPERQIVKERRRLGNEEAEAMIDAFKTNRGSILLAVQGARFSEGEDFPGDQMDVSVVVGLSLPPPSPLLYAEFTHSQLGKHDAYLVISLLPAIRKAVQAAGRHIRSPDKKGMVFFMDSRFLNPEILKMIPDWLKRDASAGDFSPDEIQTMVSDFFTHH